MTICKRLGEYFVGIWPLNRETWKNWD